MFVKKVDKVKYNKEKELKKKLKKLKKLKKFEIDKIKELKNRFSDEKICKDSMQKKLKVDILRRTDESTPLSKFKTL
jgi:hypothetical protein